MGFLAVIPSLIYIGIIAFSICAIITVLKLMREKNGYLKDIRDEIRKQNDDKLTK
ncbi:hypothetical protein [Bacillus paramycoides]|uniref:hypothetical protein n=1 Tax=Bacillus paramycoides TaxID=2026194 RepID=UPI00027A12EF|nr:hypothetical protein [Bacillus paramycoides]EJR46307.1 hypothetical protein IIM_04816 [Bacillus cereus VD107]MED0970816.1 hypothetical protein [Bacillus paramycoides]MED0982691.1 hypothetical protein [Bacillus paramycoides]MED1107804.1 hypothetical protein [Bacillus paramycoides]